MMLRSAGVPARYVEGYSFDTSAGHNADGSTSYTEYKVITENSSLQIKTMSGYPWPIQLRMRGCSIMLTG